MKLVIDNISKQFNTHYAVKQFSTQLTKGVYALLGPNGSGKTTLMRMMAGISKPTSGSVLLNQEDISVLDENYRELLGYLPQEFGVYKNFTAERFLKYFARLKGLNRQETDQKVDELLELVNLTNERKRKAGTFSGGMKRRLGIAQALLNDPKILIVDEPTAGLDPQERIRFRNLLSDISEERIVLFSTHIVSDIEYIAKEILIMKQGELIQQSDVSTLLKELDGKVWQADIQQEDLSYVQQSFKVGNIQRQDRGITLRIVSDLQPTENAENVTPNLEDVYLQYFSETSETEG